MLHSIAGYNTPVVRQHDMHQITKIRSAMAAGVLQFMSHILGLGSLV